MNYINTIMNFLTQYDYIILPVISGILVLFAVVNFCKNVYRKQNKKIVAVTRKLCSFPHNMEQYSKGLPKEYRRQWRAYVNSKAKQPSTVFEFARIANKIYLLRLVILAALINTVYIAIFALNTSRIEYLVYQIVFWLAFTLVLVADRAIYKTHERKAKNIFARFANELNRIVPKEQTKEEHFDETIKELKQLKRCEPTNAIFDRAADLLRDKGLHGERTVEEQRKLNGAINGLLQSYTKQHNV